PHHLSGGRVDRLYLVQLQARGVLAGTVGRVQHTVRDERRGRPAVEHRPLQVQLRVAGRVDGDLEAGDTAVPGDEHPYRLARRIGPHRALRAHVAHRCEREQLQLAAGVAGRTLTGQVRQVQ